jgi:DNA-binding transcriptional LysR family regulator
MSVDPDDLRFVHAVAEHKSLLGAARALGVDKATVIRRIDAAELSLGTKLVDRRPHGWVLTPAGEQASASAERIRGVLEELRLTLSGETGGVVRATAPAWVSRVLLIPAMARFAERWPAIDLRLVTTNEILDLTRREADVALRNVRPTQARLVCRRVGELALGVYASRAYLAKHGVPTASSLAGHRVVGYEGRLVHPEAHQLLAAGPPVTFRTTDTMALADAIRAGLGLGSIPCLLGDDDPELVRTPLPVARDDIFVVFPDDLRDVPRVRAVIDWLVETWRAREDAMAAR